MAAAGELLSRGIKTLARCETPALDAALLLARAAGTSREELYAHGERELGPAEEGRYAAFLKRRLEGESVAVILGRREFWGLCFMVNSAVLVPRPDTETLVEAALDILRRGAGIPRSGGPSAPLRALDLCTGSGAVAVALKHELPGLEVWASDVSEAALEVARTNARRLLPAGGESNGPEGIRFFRGDLFAALENTAPSGGREARPPEGPRFVLITANAPYVPSGALAGLAPEARREPALALDGGEDGLALIRRIINGAPPYLEQGGTLALEADPSQMADIAPLMEERGFGPPALYRDLAGKDRVITGIRP
ncbi:MAG: peptide chain release factor N(5)-glutamine methyltransferase [Treponema sp.]|nr:peptide chain release factor N(5)-glutamine methyltransferase [Treponema sp.]